MDDFDRMQQHYDRLKHKFRTALCEAVEHENARLRLALHESQQRVKELEESVQRCRWAAKVADNEKAARIKVEQQLTQQQAAIQKLVEALKGAHCSDCNNVGWYSSPTSGGDLEQVQCMWCAHRDSALSIAFTWLPKEGDD